MTSWTEMPLGCFDVESTGVSITEDQIVTAFVGRVDGSVVRRRHWVAQPSIPIPAEATDIHGVDDEYVRKHGRPHKGVVTEIVNELYACWSEGRVVAAYNGSFDFSLIATHAPGFEIRGPIFDAFVADKHYDRFRKGSRKLSAVMINYGMRLDDAHDAEADAVAAARLAWKLPRVYPELAQYTADELMAKQTEWYADQATSLIDYLKRKELPYADVSTEWPIRRVEKAQAA
ncbi:exonuclease domain-containing protein [Nocardia sp. NPDC049707]|uniref:exonuclease domain-containing protein n=1 Tax=Nocardia sp. NPDC049707 TaxID=3154735 RepID=UPI003428758E